MKSFKGEQMSITKKVTFIAKEDCIEQMKELLRTMVQLSKEEKGCFAYDIFQLKDKPKEFLVVESWANNDALEGHKHSAHYKFYKENYEPFCAQKYSDDLEII